MFLHGTIVNALPTMPAELLARQAEALDAPLGRYRDDPVLPCSVELIPHAATVWVRWQIAVWADI